MKFYNLEDIKKHLEQLKAEHRAKVEAWQNVTIEKKKNGEEFAQLGKALKNARFSYPFYESDKMHPQIEIYTRANNKSIQDTIEIYGTLKDAPEKEQDHETRRNGWQYPIYIFTFDEIREAIASRIEWHKNKIEDFAEQEKRAKKAYTQYQKAIANAEKQLKENCGISGNGAPLYNNSLYYAIKESI